MDADSTVAEAINVLSERTRDDTFKAHCSKLKDDMFICKFEYDSKKMKKKVLNTIRCLRKVFKRHSGSISSSTKVKINDFKSENVLYKGMMSISIDNLYSSFFNAELIDDVKDTIFYKLYT